MVYMKTLPYKSHSIPGMWSLSKAREILDFSDKAIAESLRLGFSRNPDTNFVSSRPRYVKTSLGSVRRWSRME